LVERDTLVHDAAGSEARLARRRQLLAMLTAETNLLGPSPTPVQRRIRAPVTWLTAEADRLNEELDEPIRQSPGWREQEDLLQTPPPASAR
jgi:transposase